MKAWLVHNCFNTVRGKVSTVKAKFCKCSKCYRYKYDAVLSTNLFNNSYNEVVLRLCPRVGGFYAGEGLSFTVNLSLWHWIVFSGFFTISLSIMNFLSVYPAIFPLSGNHSLANIDVCLDNSEESLWSPSFLPTPSQSISVLIWISQFISSTYLFIVHYVPGNDGGIENIKVKKERERKS